MFRLHVLPAGVGDALVLDYGTTNGLHRVVVDGGVKKTAEPLAGFLGPTPEIELLVVTHIDNDHIAGILHLLEADLSRPRLGDVWFNGFCHLPGPLEPMGPVEGERLTSLMVARQLPWNTNPAFGGGPVTVGEAAAPRTATLPGGLSCTVISPGLDELRKLRATWAPVVQEADLDPARPVEPEPLPPAGRLERMGAVDLPLLAETRTPQDNKEANGSSIAFVASWAGRTVLLTGDAHPAVLLDGLTRWLGPDGTLEVDVFKLPHHGSKANVTAELMRRVKARCYVFSSSGEGRSQHPNDQAVARVILGSQGPRELAFNYRNDRTAFWDDPELKAAHGYATRYPQDASLGLTVDLMTL